MGISIAYRGRIADLARLEDFEDRVIDHAVEIGASARVWRSWPDDQLERQLRGVILTVAPGQEATSLVVSPEGWLVSLIDLEDAENGRLGEPPWCFVKTQYGPVEGHVALVEMLAALKREFLPDLEVHDDGGYWETRNLAELVRNHAMTRAAIDGLAAGLERFGLNHEAAEDPAILLRHVERVAEHVHRTLHESAEKPWDDISEQEHRRPEQPECANDERRSGELDGATAFRDMLMENDVAHLHDDEAERPDKPSHDDDHPSSAQLFTDVRGEFGKANEAEERHHSLLQEAISLRARLDSIFRDQAPESLVALGVLHQAAGDASDALTQAQALAPRGHDAEADHGSRAAQFKRSSSRCCVGPWRPLPTSTKHERRTV